MWSLKNRTPYAAERNWTRDKDGMHVWIVAVRATFDVAEDGGMMLADVQPPPALAPEYFGEPGASSLRYDSELLAPKPAADVVVLASAHAPRGVAAPVVPVSLRVGALEKELLVFGERLYYEGVVGMTTSAPRPFTTRPIRYESAFGGYDRADPDPARHRLDARNPVGRGFAARSAHLVHTPAHAIEYPRGHVERTGPAGFGPIDASWMPRRALAGTYDARWERTKKPLLADDYDPAFALSAPVDQRLARPLQGGERVELRNLTPRGVLSFALPRIALALTTYLGPRREEHDARLATVILEPDERRLSLVWQGTLRVGARDAEYLDQTEIVERRGAA